jgi:hypothetical protein
LEIGELSGYVREGCVECGVQCAGRSVGCSLWSARGISDWFQESGRSGRENEGITSVIAITPAIIREGAETDPNTVTSTLNQMVVREYILEQECQRKVGNHRSFRQFGSDV